MNASPKPDMPKRLMNSGVTTPTPSELAPEAIWQDGLEHLLASLGTTPRGLSGAEAKARLAIYGPNDAATAKRLRFWMHLVLWS